MCLIAVYIVERSWWKFGLDFLCLSGKNLRWLTTFCNNESFVKLIHIMHIVTLSPKELESL